MKIGCVSDLHGYQPAIKDCDLLLIAGDLTNKGEHFELQEFWDWTNFLAEYIPNIVLIAGNHDFGLQKVKPFTRSCGNVHYLSNSSITIDGLKIFGCPWTLRFHDWAFNADEEDMFRYAEMCPRDSDIIIGHSPVRNILDSSLKDDRLGSIAMKILCEEINPKLYVHGHIHASVGQVKVNDTIYINASYLNDSYKPNEKSPIYLEL